MRSLVVALVAVLSMAASPVLAQATSSPFVDRFRTLCDAGEGDGPRALALAREEGWALLPSAMFESEDNPFEQVTAMMNAEPDGTLAILMTGTMIQDFEGTPMTMAVCGVMGGDIENGRPVSPDPTPIVRKWLAMTPSPDFSSDGREGYVFTRAGEDRREITSEAATLQAVLNGEMHVIMAGTEEAMSMILYMRPRL